MQRKHNYSKRKKRPNLPFGKNLLHVASAGVGKFALLVVVVFSFSLGKTFSYLLFFWYLPSAFFFFGVKKKILIPVYEGRTRGDKGGGCHPPKVFPSFLLDDKYQHLMFSVAVRSSLARILSQVQ